MSTMEDEKENEEILFLINFKPLFMPLFSSAYAENGPHLFLFFQGTKERYDEKQGLMG